MHGLRLAWSNDNTVSEIFMHKMMRAERIYRQNYIIREMMHAEKIYLADNETLCQYKEWTHPNVPGCLCCPSVCSLFAGGAPPPDTGGQPLLFCGFISCAGEDCTWESVLSAPFNLHFGVAYKHSKHTCDEGDLAAIQQIMSGAIRICGRSERRVLQICALHVRF